MLRNDVFAAAVTTIYLVIYVALIQFENTQPYAIGMFIFSPLLVCWMVITIIKFGKYKGPSLGDDEFGYQDVDKENIGIF